MIGSAVSKDQIFGDSERRFSATGKDKKVWDLVIDEDSGKVVFFNLLTGEKKDEKPFGLMLSKEDDELWQRSRDSVK